MPVYSSAVPPLALWPGDAVTVWSAETPVPGVGGTAASIPVALGTRGSGVRNVGVSGLFSGAPAAFEIDVQGSDVNADNQFRDVGAITVADATNFSFYLDIPNFSGKFVRLLMRTRTGNVTVTASIHL